MSERTPIIWKVTHEKHKTRFFLVYDGACIVTNSGKAFAHPVAIEFNRTNQDDNAPPDQMNYVHATFGNFALGAIEIKEGQIEALPLAQMGFSRLAALRALQEVEYFVTLPVFQYWSGEAVYDSKATKEQIPAAAKYKQASHVWKLVAWMKWDSWNKQELTYKERAQHLTKMGFTVTESAVKSASQIKGLPTISTRKK
jgi:hypothetical protein